MFELFISFLGLLILLNLKFLSQSFSLKSSNFCRTTLPVLLSLYQNPNLLDHLNFHQINLLQKLIFKILEQSIGVPE